MDQLKGFASKLASGQGSSTANNNQAAPAAGGDPNVAAPAGEKEDYGDKAFDFASKKTGHTFDRNTSEKITDGIRGAYEKATGSKVDPKYSN